MSKITVSDVERMQKDNDVTGLIDACWSRDFDVNKSARFAIHSINNHELFKNEKVVMKLLKTLKRYPSKLFFISMFQHPPPTYSLNRQMAVYALQFVGDPRIIQPLIEDFSGSKDPSIRDVYRQAFLSIGKPAAKPLAKFLTDKRCFDTKLFDTLEILGKLGDPVAVDAIINRIYQQVSAACAGSGGNMRQFRTSAFMALEAIGESRGVERLIPLFDMNLIFVDSQEFFRALRSTLDRLHVPVNRPSLE